jgi:hypothetical protein
MHVLDRTRSVLRPGFFQAAVDLELELVQEFPPEISRLFHESQHRFVGSSRTPELLNYFLRPPTGAVSGWLCRIKGRLAGFALTSVRERDGLRVGKLLDCYMVDADALVWKSAIRALTNKLAEAKCHVAQAMASAPWFQRALRASGYFPRGRGAFFLRDPRNLVPSDLPFHFTLLDGDQFF